MHRSIENESAVLIKGNFNYSRGTTEANKLKIPININFNVDKMILKVALFHDNGGTVTEMLTMKTNLVRNPSTEILSVDLIDSATSYTVAYDIPFDCMANVNGTYTFELVNMEGKPPSNIADIDIDFSATLLFIKYDSK